MLKMLSTGSQATIPLWRTLSSTDPKASEGGAPDWACGSCHLPNGKGRPSNAPAAGKPAAYMVQQLHDMRDGLRYSADPRKPNTPNMIRMARAMTEEEIQESSEFWAAVPWTRRMYVMEADLIPEMYLNPDNNMFFTVGTEPTEPLAGRIVETPMDTYQADYLRNPRAGFNVYVPVGSLAKGEELVLNGGDGKTIAVCYLSRTGPHGSRCDSRSRRPLAQLSDAAVIRLQTGDQEWCCCTTNATRPSQT